MFNRPAAGNIRAGRIRRPGNRWIVVGAAVV
jgi:hypothetical protein